MPERGLEIQIPTHLPTMRDKEIEVTLRYITIREPRDHMNGSLSVSYFYRVYDSKYYYRFIIDIKMTLFPWKR